MQNKFYTDFQRLTEQINVYFPPTEVVIPEVNKEKGK